MSHPIAIISVALGFIALGLIIVYLLKTRAEYQREVDAWKARLQSDLESARGERDRLLNALNDSVFLIDEIGRASCRERVYHPV